MKDLVNVCQANIAFSSSPNPGCPSERNAASHRRPAGLFHRQRPRAWQALSMLGFSNCWMLQQSYLAILENCSMLFFSGSILLYAQFCGVIRKILSRLFNAQVAGMLPRGQQQIAGPAASSSQPTQQPPMLEGVVRKQWHGISAQTF